MAMIKCVECGNVISDKAATCPHCGISLRSTPPFGRQYYVNEGFSAGEPVGQMPPVVPQSDSSARVIGMNANNLVCPGCGTRLGSKDILSSGWARCPQCKRDVALTGSTTSFSDGIVEKIYPFEATKERFHEKCMQKMMDVAHEDFFREVRDIKPSQKYIWVREFGSGANRQIYPMCQYGERFFESINAGIPFIDCSKYDLWFLTRNMLEFNSNEIRGKELIPKEMSAKECKHKYTTHMQTKNYSATDNYYCLPVAEETMVYNGQEYCFRGIGDSKISELSWSGLPSEEEVLCGKPKYTEMMPFTITLVVLLVIAAAITIISIFSSNGFWGGLLVTFLVGIVVAIVGTICMVPVMGVTAGLDAIVRRTINSNRRRKFRARYEEIQARKQSDAKSIHGLNLSYEVPDYPY